jgi:hypothetical protein
LPLSFLLIACLAFRSQSGLIKEFRTRSSRLQGFKNTFAGVRILLAGNEVVRETPHRRFASVLARSIDQSDEKIEHCASFKRLYVIEQKDSLRGLWLLHRQDYKNR